jgi:hypothetical protein
MVSRRPPVSCPAMGGCAGDDDDDDDIPFPARSRDDHRPGGSAIGPRSGLKFCSRLPVRHPDGSTAACGGGCGRAYRRRDRGGARFDCTYPRSPPFSSRRIHVQGEEGSQTKGADSVCSTTIALLSFHKLYRIPGYKLDISTLTRQPRAISAARRLDDATATRVTRTIGSAPTSCGKRAGALCPRPVCSLRTANVQATTTATWNGRCDDNLFPIDRRRAQGAHANAV